MPVEGKPVNSVLPVDIVHVGGVIVPIKGAVGVVGCALMTTLSDNTDVHPDELVTVKANVPAVILEIVVLVPVPVVVTAPGLRINVHVPVDGNPFNITLPVATEHVGWVIVPNVGAAGMAFTVNV